MKIIHDMVMRMILFVLVTAQFCSCRPRVITITPTSGPPGTLVHVTGDGLFASLVKWDAGTTAERTLPGSFLSASFFTVPSDAGVGAHNVRIFGDGRYSDNTPVFTVTDGTRHPAPRVDDITCRSFVQRGTDSASFLLMVHGANFDVGAQIMIGSAPQSSAFWRGLGNTANMLATDPSTLGYPIFHYGTLVCAVPSIAFGDSILEVGVRNPDGTMSINRRKYYVAHRLRDLDSDGDGLSDEWEKNGADVDSNGTIDVDLPAMGANYLRKDLFIETDWMDRYVPPDNLWPYAENVFRNAPVLNCDGSAGISLHIDHGQGGLFSQGGQAVPWSMGLVFGPDIACNIPQHPEARCQDFYELKRRFFDPSRLPIFRYCIFCEQNGNGGGSGQAEPGGWSNDFYVAARNYGLAADTFGFIMQGSFLHELGHTLGLAHGGNDGLRRKPNYMSVMNSTYSGVGVESNCNLATWDFRMYTYSQGMMRPLDENCLNEPEGLCDGIPRDWNENGDNTERCIRAHIHEDDGYTILRDYADWANLKYGFTGPGSGWHRN